MFCLTQELHATATRSVGGRCLPAALWIGHALGHLYWPGTGLSTWPEASNHPQRCQAFELVPQPGLGGWKHAEGKLLSEHFTRPTYGNGQVEDHLPHWILSTYLIWNCIHARTHTLYIYVYLCVYIYMLLCTVMICGFSYVLQRDTSPPVRWNLETLAFAKSCPGGHGLHDG